MKRNGKNWALRVLLTTLVVAGMSAPASTEGAVSGMDGRHIETFVHPSTLVSNHVHGLPVVEEEALSPLDEREPVLDDTSQDGTDETRIPSQLVELDLFCTGLNRVAGPLLNHLAEAGLATQMACCVWRC